MRDSILCPKLDNVACFNKFSLTNIKCVFPSGLLTTKSNSPKEIDSSQQV